MCVCVCVIVCVCVDVCGRVWTCVEVCGRVWTCVDVCGSVCVDVCGRVWTCVDAFGRVNLHACNLSLSSYHFTRLCVCLFVLPLCVRIPHPGFSFQGECSDVSVSSHGGGPGDGLRVCTLTSFGCVVRGGCWWGWQMIASLKCSGSSWRLTVTFLRTQRRTSWCIRRFTRNMCVRACVRMLMHSRHPGLCSPPPFFRFGDLVLSVVPLSPGGTPTLQTDLVESFIEERLTESIEGFSMADFLVMLQLRGGLESPPFPFPSHRG